MSSILDDIVSATRERVAKAAINIPVAELKSRQGFERPMRSLAAALSNGPMNVIAEIKSASPSAGEIRPGAKPSEIATGYEDAGASAISVLTEPQWFGGSLENLETVSSSVSIPVLRKDFIIDEYQVYEARAFGADAILLIVRILDRDELADLHALATSLGLEVLVELYDIDELDRVDIDTMKIVGANNRNLSTMTVDINHSISILAELPETTIRVSESGIENHDDLSILVDNRIHAALIGESLMRSADPSEALRALLTPFSLSS